MLQSIFSGASQLKDYSHYVYICTISYFIQIYIYTHIHTHIWNTYIQLCIYICPVVTQLEAKLCLDKQCIIRSLFLQGWLMSVRHSAAGLMTSNPPTTEIWAREWSTDEGWGYHVCICGELSWNEEIISWSWFIWTATVIYGPKYSGLKATGNARGESYKNENCIWL